MSSLAGNLSSAWMTQLANQWRNSRLGLFPMIHPSAQRNKSKHASLDRCECTPKYGQPMDWRLMHSRWLFRRERVCWSWCWPVTSRPQSTATARNPTHPPSPTPTIQIHHITHPNHRCIIQHTPHPPEKSSTTGCNNHCYRWWKWKQDRKKWGESNMKLVF